MFINQIKTKKENTKKGKENEELEKGKYTD